ncbi:carbohydrate porin [Cyanobium sp. ATX 6A2]|uniref:iron uptake porin n=1 Tax=Cyanobium sp. ATX 6A2 TaxID=2823700 RepID=UPI0020CCF046|nr:iron uptake porin [Cyanobium sp. ATX 6A2]MCP9888177.1 carbohydrate porin [Cyanobium sp. ATX 6A2]
MASSQSLALALISAGLFTPCLASAADLGGRDLALEELSRYGDSGSLDQVTSISQFPDVRPTDWAYQALANLIERYGCVAGYPDGTFKGQRAMTRFEAAALLNACLDRVTEVTDELKRLMAEFERELAILKGRVDGLEAKVGELEANQFSTTTKLRGEASFILAGSPDFDSPLRASDGSRPARPNETTFNYDLRLVLDTSFTGKDLLRTRLRSGNFSSLPFRSGIFTLDKATGTDDSVEIDRLFYRFPVGESFNVTVGPLARNTEMLSFIPSAYKSDILDFFGLAGASGTYNKATGAGVGLSWRQQVEKGNPYVTFDTNYVANNGFADSSVGAFSSDSGINALTQLGYRGRNWGVALGYRYGTENSSLRNANFSSRVPDGGNNNSLSLAGYWSPIESTWIPSISLGYGYNWASGGLDDSQSWMAGLQWSDVGWAGNAAGFALGQPPFTGGENNSMLYELFYRFRVTDNITITPAVFYGSDVASNSGNDAWGGVIQTTFRF